MPVHWLHKRRRANKIRNALRRFMRKYGYNDWLIEWPEAELVFCGKSTPTAPKEEFVVREYIKGRPLRRQWERLQRTFDRLTPEEIHELERTFDPCANAALSMPSTMERWSPTSG